MADVSRTIYLSRKLSSVTEESSKHMYDGIFSAPAPASHAASNFAARIDDYREIFPPAKASLGSSIPILDLPAVDRSVASVRAVSPGFDYADVFGGFGDNCGFEGPSEKLFCDSKRTAKHDAKLPRLPTRRMPSKSQEFSCNYGNDQVSSPVQSRRIPSKSQEFSCDYENDKASISAQARRMPSANQDFACNYAKDEISSPTQIRIVPSKCQELPVSYGQDQTSSPVQKRRVPSKSQEFSCSYENDQTSSPVQPRRMPPKSQEFSCNNGNGQTISPTQTRRQPSRSQEFFCTSSNDQTSASPLPLQAADSVQHVSVSYHKSNQLSKDSTNGTTHIAHLHAVPGYTLLFDEAGPVRKSGFDKAKRLSMNDADFSVAVDKASRQGKHMRTVSDLGTNQLASDNDSLTPSVSISNSPQSFRSSGYLKRPSIRRHRSSKKNREKNPFLDEELDVTSAAAICAAAMKRAIEEAEEKMRWAKQFLRELESNGFIKPTLKDSFKVKVTCVTEAYGPKRNGSLKVKASRQKKCLNDEIIVKQNGNSNSRASGEIKPKVDPEIASQNQLETEASGLKQILNVISAGVGSTVRIPAPETFTESNVDDELKLADNSDKHEGGGEWEAAKHLSQLFTGVKNRFVSFMSKQADTEKTVVQKDALSKCGSLEQTVESTHEVLNMHTNQAREANLEHTEEKVETGHSSCSVVGDSAHDSMKTSVDLGNSVANENEVNRSVSASSPDIEIFTSKQWGASKSLDELTSRTNGLYVFQEVREQNQEILDGAMKIERESETSAIEQELREIPAHPCQLEAYEDEVKNREGDAEILNEVPGLETAEKKVDEARNNVVVTSGHIEGCNLKEIEKPKDTRMVQEDVRMVEDTFTVEECNERRAGAGQDVTNEANEDLIEVVDDVCEHDVRLAENDDTSEQDDLFLSKNDEARVPYKIKQCESSVKFFSEEKGRMTELAATVSFEPKEDVIGELPQSVQRANELIGEGVCEQTPCCSEASDDECQHDEYLPAVDGILEQEEFLSSIRNEEASLHETVTEQDLPSLKESLKEAISSSFEPEVKIDKFNSVQMVAGLNGEFIPEYSGSHSKAADELLEHVNRVSETSQDREVAFEEERMTTGGGCISEIKRKEQPSSRQMANEFVGEEMTETSMPAGDGLDLDNTEKDIEKAHEAIPFTDVGMTECETVLKFEQKHSNDFASETGPGNQDDESEVSAREANDESSHKRRRWFENRNLPGIFLGNERTLENAEGFTVEDRVEICADEIVNDSDEGFCLEQDDAGVVKDQEGEDLHTTESSHRRRRWFENSSEKVDLKPIPINETAEELKQDARSDDILVNERKDSADGMESGNIASDKGECRANTEAGYRRRRWFENGVKLGTTKQEEEVNKELNETSTSEELTNTHQSEVQSKEREKEKERLAVERAIREARQRAFVEARDRAAAEARLKATAALDRLGKASSEAKPGQSEKASMDAKLKAERAAVERATYEARERAMLKAISEKVYFKARVLDTRNLNSGSSSSSGYSTFEIPCTSERPNGVTPESPQRRKAISERNKRTMERAAKALEEKNMRDVLVQKEQAERTRFSALLDAEVKRWSSGKEGNLRSLLSTLQYVLGPDSGWQPIPLTDLVTTTAVRKAYKRAALCVHPDKLQQRRATVQHKYICEKVFDLLKDAWQKFNPEDR